MATHTEADYVYEHAPLVEVIAEVRWSVISLSAIPGGAVDPAFRLGRDKFTERAKKLGYVQVEELAPAQVPIEILGRRPLLRFRKQKNKWPLYQIGQGIFSCNIVPPYDGWMDFRQSLRLGLEALFEALPLGSDFGRLEKLELRYIDAFTAEHGLKSYDAFVREALGIGVSVREGLAQVSGGQPIEFSTVEIQFPLREENSRLLLKVSPGEKDGIPAAIAEFRVTAQNGNRFTEAEHVGDWMDFAHGRLHSAFEFTTSKKLKEKMGPKHLVKGA